MNTNSKILVVSYLPGLQHSKTKRLLDTFIENVKNKTGIELLDLLKDSPDFISSEILNAYVRRNYQGKELSDDQKKCMNKFDRMAKQFKSADIVVIVFPVYNFSLPGLVKVYFDSVMLKGETFDTGTKGFVGLMGGKKALVLSSSGGDFSGEYAKYDHATPLARHLLGFMGFSEIKLISAQGVDMESKNVEEIISTAQMEIKKVIKEWDL